MSELLLMSERLLKYVGSGSLSRHQEVPCKPIPYGKHPFFIRVICRAPDLASQSASGALSRRRFHGSIPRKVWTSDRDNVVR